MEPKTPYDADAAPLDPVGDFPNAGTIDPPDAPLGGAQGASASPAPAPESDPAGRVFARAPNGARAEVTLNAGGRVVWVVDPVTEKPNAFVTGLSKQEYRDLKERLAALAPPPTPEAVDAADVAPPVDDGFGGMPLPDTGVKPLGSDAGMLAEASDAAGVDDDESAYDPEVMDESDHSPGCTRVAREEAGARCHGCNARVTPQLDDAETEAIVDMTETMTNMFAPNKRPFDKGEREKVTKAAPVIAKYAGAAIAFLPEAMALMALYEVAANRRRPACPHCAALLLAHDQPHCGACGKSVNARLRCGVTTCGSNIPPGVKFCVVCGTTAKKAIAVESEVAA